MSGIGLQKPGRNPNDPLSHFNTSAASRVTLQPGQEVQDSFMTFYSHEFSPKVIKTITDAQKRVAVNERGNMFVVPEQDYNSNRTKLGNSVISIDKKMKENIILDTVSFGGSQISQEEVIDNRGGFGGLVNSPFD